MRVRREPGIGQEWIILRRVTTERGAARL